jgi:hypothetical protein
MTTIPNDPIAVLLGQTALKNSLFEGGSRYYGLEPLTLTVAGRVVVYLPRRFVPSPARFQLLEEHTVMSGERPDHIAAQLLGDPTLFWRLCDANNALRPEALTETPGRVLRITLPEGVTGSPL